MSIVTNQEEVPHAVLIRAIEPAEGLEIMLKRRNKSSVERNLTAGPGALAQALGINTQHNGFLLTGSHIWMEDEGHFVSKEEIISSPRVGVAYEPISLFPLLIFLLFLASFYCLFSAILIKIVRKKTIKICSKIVRNLNKGNSEIGSRRRRCSASLALSLKK